LSFCCAWYEKLRDITNVYSSYYFCFSPAFQAERGWVYTPQVADLRL
jgi:hypothetical protein